MVWKRVNNAMGNENVNWGEEGGSYYWVLELFWRGGSVGGRSSERTKESRRSLNSV